MQIAVPYGDRQQTAEIEDGIEIQMIAPQGARTDKPVEQMLKEALDHPIGTDRLEEMIRPEDHVTMIVNDHTRPGPNAMMVAELVKRLNSAGMKDDHIVIVIATGSHRASTPAELDMLLGEKLRQRFRVVMHDCKDDSRLTYLGDTASGMPLWVNTAVAESSFIITTGLVAPHSAAGFSGGRKSIVPGVAGLKTLRIHHSLPIRPYEPSMGFLEGNPFHEAALEAARKVNVRFMLNVVQDPKKNNIAFVAGDLEQAHARGVAICRQANTVEVSGLADVVVASPGGYPRDSNLYQAQKALAVAELLVKPGEGVMILCARAEDGIGEGLFRQWMVEGNSPEEIIERFRKEGFSVGNNKAFMYARALTKGRVIVVSENVSEKELSEMMLEWAPDLQTALEKACKEKRPQKIIVLPRAVNIIPRVK